MKIFKTIILLLIIGGIACLFYFQEIVYLMPTPQPLNLQQPALGSMASQKTIRYVEPNPKIKLLHFFNPSCPCSKFNKKHLEDLVREYKEHVDFYAIIEKDNGSELDNAFEGNVRVIHDINQEIAKQFGVYSTPQAVVLDSNFRIAYRGNFNKARFCSAKNTQYAKVALDSLLSGNKSFMLSKSAYQAYGCAIY